MHLDGFKIPNKWKGNGKWMTSGSVSEYSYLMKVFRGDLRSWKIITLLVKPCAD